MKHDPETVCDHFEDEGVARPEVEHQFAKSVSFVSKKDGRTRQRKWAFDFAWPARLVALEIEGGVWIGKGHGRGVGIHKDMLKYNCATLLGWKVIRVQPKEVFSESTVEMIRAALALPCSQPMPKPRIKNK